MNLIYLSLAISLAVLAYFDVKRKCDIPEHVMHIFIGFSILAAVLTVFQPDFNPLWFVFSIIILGVLSFALFVIGFWGLADVVVVLSIAFVAPTFAITALFFAILVYVLFRLTTWVDRAIEGISKKEAVPFIPFLLAGFLMAWHLPLVVQLLSSVGV